MMTVAATPATQGIACMMTEDTKTWFSRNVERNMDALYGVALRLTNNRAEAEDLVADSVLAAWKAVDSLTDRERFRPWLFRIMNNRFISLCRKRSVRPQEVSTDWPEAGAGDEICSFLMEQSDDFLDWWANPEQETLDRMLGEQIRSAIDALPEVFRTTVLLVNVDGLRYDEAAEALGVPPGTVRSRMKRGRTLLQKALWTVAVESGIRNPVAGKGETS
jgi:RNA polymerase sigma-70 factor (ECF subfamily)